MPRINYYHFFLIKLALPTALLYVLLSASVFGQEMSDDKAFRNFEPNFEFLVDLNGETSRQTQLFLSKSANSYLILTPELRSAILLVIPTLEVQSLDLKKLIKHANGLVDILPDTIFEKNGKFKIVPNEIHFEVEGKKAKLIRKPDLVGLYKTDKLLLDNPAYADQGYTPEATELAALRGQSKNVRVLIYFGTWNPHCSRLMPKVLKVAKDLEGSRILFEYYGLPTKVSSDQRAASDQIRGVPTGIVYVDDQEVGRLSVRELENPEISIKSLLESN